MEGRSGYKFPRRDDVLSVSVFESLFKVSRLSGPTASPFVMRQFSDAPLTPPKNDGDDVT